MINLKHDGKCSNPWANMGYYLMNSNMLISYNQSQPWMGQFWLLQLARWIILDKVTVLECNHAHLSQVQFSSVQSVVSNSLRSHELQHARSPCPSPAPRVHPNPCPSSRWYHPTISSSVVPFSSCPQSFPASGSFQMSQLFASGGQSIGVSASTSVPPINTLCWVFTAEIKCNTGLISFRMDWLDLLAVQGTPRLA